MIEILKPLLDTNRVSVTLDAANPKEASVTIVIAPFKNTERAKTFQYIGDINELEVNLAADLPTAVTKVVEHQNTMADLDAQLEAEKKAAEEKAKARTAKKAPAKKAAAKKPSKAAVKQKEKEQSMDKLKKDLPKPKVEAPPAAKPATPATPVAVEDVASALGPIDFDFGDA